MFSLLWNLLALNAYLWIISSSFLFECVIVSSAIYWCIVLSCTLTFLYFNSCPSHHRVSSLVNTVLNILLLTMCAIHVWASCYYGFDRDIYIIYRLQYVYADGCNAMNKCLYLYCLFTYTIVLYTLIMCPFCAHYPTLKYYMKLCICGILLNKIYIYIYSFDNMLLSSLPQHRYVLPFLTW